MMKKFFISWLLILCLLTASVSFAACGENKEGDLSQPTVDFEDLPDAGIDVKVEEYPLLCYDENEAAVTDPSVAEGTLRVSYTAEKNVSLFTEKESIVTVKSETVSVIDGRCYASYVLSATDVGEYRLFFVSEDNKLAESFRWRVASVYPTEVSFSPLNGFGGVGGAAAGEVNASDPSVIEVDGKYYTFGADNYGLFGYSIRCSNDLIVWENTGVAIPGFNENGLAPGDSNNPTVNNELWDIYQIICADPNWGVKGSGYNGGGSWALSAPAIVPAYGGGYWLYGSWTADLGQGHSIIFQCYSDEIKGPYTLVYTENNNPAVLLYSFDGWPTNNRNPNALDPYVYYDAEGKMYMAYGSFGDGAGIWSLELDPKTGLRADGLEGADLLAGSTVPAAQRYGTSLVVNGTGSSAMSYHERIEISSFDGTSPYNAEESRYEGRYFLMTSSGDFLQGYNMRCYSSASPTGPFQAENGGVRGSRVSGSFSWRTGKEASSGDLGFKDWYSPGRNDFLQTSEGEELLVVSLQDEFSSNNYFQAQTLYAFNSRGEIVMNPNRYAGERLRKVTAAEIYTLTDGAYSFAYVTSNAYADSYNGGYAMEGLELREDGSIYFNDAAVGTWVLYGDNYVLLNITTAISAATGGGSLSGKFYGVAFPAHIEKDLAGGISISCVSEDGQNCLYLNMDFPD